MKRRRFLQIFAASAVVGRAAQAETWRGRAFGADIALTLPGRVPMQAVLAEIAAIEACFSLFQPSELVALNATGRGPGSTRMREVLALSGQVHAATSGAFDPTVQPLWAALAAGRSGAAERGKIGLQRVEIGDEIILREGQELTLNGIVQGYAADRIAALLAREDVPECLVDMGEFVGLGGPWPLGIEDPQAGLIGRRRIGQGADRALATSSPAALPLAGGSHILGPNGAPPLWSTATVGAPTAALADAASTAFVLMERGAIVRAKTKLGLGAVTLVDFEGNLQTL